MEVFNGEYHHSKEKTMKDQRLTYVRHFKSLYRKKLFASLQAVHGLPPEAD
jgi:hypothetical protein